MEEKKRDIMNIEYAIECKVLLNEVDSAIVPPPRAGSVLLMLDENRLILVGGANGEGDHFNDVWIYTLADRFWKKQITTGDDKLPQLSGHSGIVIGKHVYIIGGLNIKEDKIYNDVYILYTDTMMWKKCEVTGCEISPRNSHSSFYSKTLKKIILFGGSSPSTGPMNDMYTLTINEAAGEGSKISSDKIIVTGDIPCAREMFASTLVDEEANPQLIVMGGRGESGNVLNDVCILNLKSMKWSKTSTPYKRVGHSMAYIKDVQSLFTFAGLNEDFKPSGGASLYNCEEGTNEWKRVNVAPDVPDERFAYSMASNTTGSEIYIYGGVNFADNLNDLHVIRPLVHGEARDDSDVKLYFEEIF